MEPENIFKKYLELVNTETNELLNHLASNSILEWYGKTYKTPQRICDHFR